MLGMATSTFELFLGAMLLSEVVLYSCHYLCELIYINKSIGVVLNMEYDSLTLEIYLCVETLISMQI